MKNLKEKRGRKSLADKKTVIRIFVLESVIKKHGTVSICKEKCTNLLNSINK